MLECDVPRTCTSPTICTFPLNAGCRWSTTTEAEHEGSDYGCQDDRNSHHQDYPDDGRYRVVVCEYCFNFHLDQGSYVASSCVESLSGEDQINTYSLPREDDAFAYTEPPVDISEAALNEL